MHSRHLYFSLNWEPRDANTLADKLTNDDFSDFDSRRRIQFTWSEVMEAFPDLSIYLRYHGDLCASVARLKEAKRSERMRDGSAKGPAGKRRKLKELEP